MGKRHAAIVAASGAAVITGMLLLSPQPGSLPQDCAEMLPGEPFNTSISCSSEPRIDRIFGGHLMMWQGTQHLVTVQGNEIRFWDVSAPRAPRWVGSSAFNVPNQGDSDYDLMNVSVCDDCRYGGAWYKTGAVLFDLGTGPRPAVIDHRYTAGATGTIGGLVYEHGGEYWLATNAYSQEECWPGAPLYRMWGVGTAAREVVQCLAADTTPLRPVGGTYDRGAVWVANENTRMYLFEANGAGLIYNDEYARAGAGKADSFATDGELLVLASNAGAVIYDTYAVGDPLEPVEVATIPGTYSRASLRGDRVFLTRAGLAGEERVYDLSTPSSPQALAGDLFDPDAAWNYPDHNCTATEAATWVTEDVLYLYRYSRLQLADFAGCEQPTPTPTPAPTPTPPPGLIWSDGFETGDTSVWL